MTSGLRIARSMLLSSPVSLGGLARPRLAPALVVVLGRDVGPELSGDAARTAIGGRFLAIELSDESDGGPDGFVLAERLLAGPREGMLRLYLGRDLLVERPLSALGDPEERVGALAREVGGLRAGELVSLSSPPPVGACAGTLELRGPNGSSLIASIRE